MPDGSSHRTPPRLYFNVFLLTAVYTNLTAFVLTTSHAYVYMGNAMKHSLMGQVRHVKEPPEL